MPRRRFNCCIFNHPRPIFCDEIDFTCSNDVINPQFGNDFAFFNNLDVGEIASNGIIPVTLVNSEGASIAPNGSGEIALIAGAYEVSYLANGVIPEGGMLSIRLELNGTTISGSPISITQTEGDTVNLTQTMIITLLEPSTLRLINNSGETVGFNYASVAVRRI